MRSFVFHPGPTLLAGSDQLHDLINRLPEGPTLLVTDADLVRLNLVERCCAELERSGRTPIAYDAVEADPSRETLLAAVDAGRSAEVKSVIGFGGGSPMDVAKLAAYLLGSGDDLDQIWGVD